MCTPPAVALTRCQCVSCVERHGDSGEHPAGERGERRGRSQDASAPRRPPVAGSGREQPVEHRVVDGWRPGHRIVDGQPAEQSGQRGELGELVTAQRARARCASTSARSLWSSEPRT